MGACLSNDKLPDNFFVVRNIHDDHRKFPKGIIEVTQVDLKYRDAHSGDEWVWPLKYLRKYGCDREIFSFEAGRKCPGGEGLYAFSTKKSSQLFDLVARNISEGGLEGDTAVLSPPSDPSRVPSLSPISPHPVPSLDPPPPPPTSDPPSHPPSTGRLPDYTNVSYNEDGQLLPVATSDHASSSPPPLPKDRRTSSSATPSPPPRVNYTEVALPESSLLVEEKELEKRVSYSEIDIKQTEEYRQQTARMRAESAHPLPDLGNAEFKIVTAAERPVRNGGSRSRNSPRPPSAPSSGAGASSSSSASTAAQRSMSEGNFSVAPGDASRHRGSNGFIPGRAHSHSACAASDPGPTQLYQNISMSKSNVAPPPIPEAQESLHSPQPNYMNYNPSLAVGGASRRSTEPTIHRDAESKPTISRHQSELQATYENLLVGKGLTSPPKMSTSSLATSPPRVAGPAMALYAQLDLGPTTSTPKVKGDISPGNDESHMTLNFSSGSAIANKTPAPMERSRSASSPPPLELQLSEDRTRSSTEILSPAEAATHVRSCDDDTMVNYSTMNFDVMEALRKTKVQREEENRKRAEEEAKEEERRKREEAEQAANPGKKKKEKKKKKKDRRNSHQ